MTNISVVGDPLAFAGFRLAGLKSVYEADESNVEEIVSQVMKSSDVIAITHSLHDKLGGRMMKRMMQDSDTIIIELPDRSGGGEDMTSKLIKEAIGFEITE